MCVNYLSPLVFIISPLHLYKLFYIILDIVKFVFQDFMELPFYRDHLMITQCLQQQNVCL